MNTNQGFDHAINSMRQTFGLDIEHNNRLKSQLPSKHAHDLSTLIASLNDLRKVKFVRVTSKQIDIGFEQPVVVGSTWVDDMLHNVRAVSYTEAWAQGGPDGMIRYVENSIKHLDSTIERVDQNIEELSSQTRKDTHKLINGIKTLIQRRNIICAWPANDDFIRDIKIELDRVNINVEVRP